MYMHFTTSNARYRDVMFIFSITMFVIATCHLIVNCIRLLQGFVDHRLTPGPAAYMENPRLGYTVLKATLFCTQEILGSAAAVSL
ncbi:hypothetical protein DXG01_014346 [Tephrocybe rancida]|nr:hypothetical protein DXG01_014346 [Tephrocybe rancida]